MSAVSDVQAYLQSVGVVDGSTGWASVRRVMHDDADRLIVLAEDGGLLPELPSPSGIGDSAWEEVGIHLRVRAEAFQGDAASVKAQEILDALHGLINVTLGSDSYHRVTSLSSEPVYLGLDESSRPEFTLNFRLLKTA